jgi:hypothetical protein
VLHGDFPSRLAHAAQHALHADEITLRMMSGHAGQEGAVTTAEVDLQRTRDIGEDLGAGDFAEMIGGDKKRRHAGRIEYTNCRGSEAKMRHVPPKAF